MNLFGTAGIRGDVRRTVTPSLALQVGQAAAAVAAGESDGGVEFVVARDGRETGEGLAAAMTAGLQSGGADVVEVGQTPTPALAFASRGRWGVMLTASHNPPTDNGIKLFCDGEEFSEEFEHAVEAEVDADAAPAEWYDWGSGNEEGVLSGYRAAIVDYASRVGAPLDGLSVVVDCGNGMASVATPQVLRELGADVVTLNANVDGHFPGRESKPTEETLGDCIEFLQTSDDVDFGIAHDGDADRIVVLTGEGEVVHEDTVLAILAAEYVRGSEAADPVVVTTPNASARIDEQVREAGGRVERVALGYLHDGIASATADGGDVVFAAEPWKHIHTQFGGWIDGVCSAAVISRLVADSSLASLREPVAERPYRKVSVHCSDDAKAAVMSRLAETLPEAFPEASVETEYGVRLERPDASWVLVRPSGTEPYVRIYAESDDIDSLVERARDVVDDAVESV
jgi:phosphomannomutase